MADADILISKRRIQDKIFTLLQQTQQALTRVVQHQALPAAITTFTGKIAKGENYRLLPYMILDYPAAFSLEDIFAYRTMFYWGNFFSATVHLQGRYLQEHRQALYARAGALIARHVYISTGRSPWHYHYGADNYTPLTWQNKEKILHDPFVKLSQKIALKDWPQVPETSAGFLQTLLEIMFTPS